MTPLKLSLCCAVMALPALAQEPDFSGPYAALDLGAGTVSEVTGSIKTGSSDVTHTRLSAGYMMELGNVLIGPEVAIARDRFSDFTSIDATNTTSFGLKAGYQMGRVMPFASASIGQGSATGTSGPTDTTVTEFAVGSDYAITDLLRGTATFRRSAQSLTGTTVTLKGTSVTVGLGLNF